MRPRAFLVNAVDRGDMQALAATEAEVERLTVDNPHQQRAIARAALLAERGERAALGDLFAGMQREEDRLMTERALRVASARTRSARVFILSAVLTLLFGAGAFGLLRTQRRELTDHRAVLEAIIESIDEGVIAVDASRRVLAMNAVARSLWGGAHPRDVWPDDWQSVLRATLEDGSPLPPDQAPLARALRGETVQNVAYRVSLVKADEKAPTVWISAGARPIRDEGGRVVAAVTTLRNVTEQRAHADRLRDQSLTDELTGLLNRRGFVTSANARIEASRRTRAPLALLYADVNGLKPINDALWHEQGDRAIKDAAEVLRAYLATGTSSAASAVTSSWRSSRTSRRARASPCSNGWRPPSGLTSSASGDRTVCP